MTEGMEYVYLETHNWGKTVKFWLEFGYELELDLGTAGRLAHPSGGTALFIEAGPADRELATQLYLRASDPEARPGPTAGLARDWCDSHWGTRLLELRDPDGRTIVVQHPGA
jgi:hypothetical protein